MPRPLPYREVKRKLETAGFSQVSQKGSHVKFQKIVTGRTITTVVLKVKYDIPLGTIRSIIKQAEISPEDWDGL